MSIQAVSFGKTVTTPKGNEYKKSYVGTIAGTLAGLGMGSYSAYRNLKPQVSMPIKRALATTYSALKQSLPKENALKLVKNVTLPIGLAVGVAIFGTIGLGIGALINKGINHYLANRADKKAEAIRNAVVK